LGEIHFSSKAVDEMAAAHPISSASHAMRVDGCRCSCVYAQLTSRDTEGRVLLVSSSARQSRPSRATIDV
jgi:hypothetical protein